MDTKRSQRYNKKKRRKLKLIPYLILVAILSLTGSIFVTNTIFAIISKNEAKHHSEIQADNNSKEKSSESTSAESTTQPSTKQNDVLPTSMDGTILTQLSTDSYENLSKAVLAPDAQEFDDQLVDTAFIGTALIVKDGKIILQKGYGFADFFNQKLNTVSSHYQIGSVEKSFTATLIYHLIEEGKISFETPLNKFYPQIAGSENIQIRDLLYMQSGLKFSFPSDLYFATSDEALDYLVANVQNTGKKTYNYQPANYNILAGIIQKVTNQNYYDNFESYFSNKVGLKNFGFYFDWPSRERYTLGYRRDENTQLYSQPDYYDPQKFVKELGSGNVDSTTGDMYWYFKQLINGNIIKEKTLQDAWSLKKNTGKYIGGMYDRDTAYRTRGAIVHEELQIIISKDSKNAVILMSNSPISNTKNPLISDFYQKISGNFVVF